MSRERGGKAERSKLEALLANIEFFQNRALDEASQLMQLDRFSISRDLLAQLRSISSVTLPHRAWKVYSPLNMAGLDESWPRLLLRAASNSNATQGGHGRHSRG